MEDSINWKQKWCKCISDLKKTIEIDCDNVQWRHIMPVLSAEFNKMTKAKNCESIVAKIIVKKIQTNFLFSINSKYQNELNSKSLGKEIQKSFKSNEVILSENDIIVKKKKEGKRWIVIDKKKFLKYEIIKEGKYLYIYRKDKKNTIIMNLKKFFSRIKLFLCGYLKKGIDNNHLINCIKNFEEAIRYLKYVLADFARHQEAFKAALSQNILRREISLLEKKRKRFLGQSFHYFFSKFNLSIPTLVFTVISVILVFALIYWSLSLGFGNQIVTSCSDLKSAEGFDYIYFSIVTLTTLGYGDFHPLTWYAKLFTAGEAIAGYVLLGFFLYTVTHLSEIHPYSPTRWMEYYEYKLKKYNNKVGNEDKSEEYDLY